jgi:D-beta-D-heptose 7-phosphate kinase/D-beta-D-heptose 1-phosphate adenosyltransferase
MPVGCLKGEGRPIQDGRACADVLAPLGAVDLVVLFDEVTPLKLIAKVRPTVLVKGGDYRPEEVVGRRIAEAAGGEIMLVDRQSG